MTLWPWDKPELLVQGMKSNIKKTKTGTNDSANGVNDGGIIDHVHLICCQ